MGFSIAEKAVQRLRKGVIMSYEVCRALLLYLQHMRYHTYHFVSHWHITASKNMVAAALLRDQDWASWWMGLQDVEMLHAVVGVGSKFRCVWRSFTGYRLRLVITITEYEAGNHIAFISAGDLVGTGSFQLFSPNENDTRMTIHWDVATTKRWMNIPAPVLKLLFVYSHHRLMCAGERGLAGYVSEHADILKN